MPWATNSPVRTVDGPVPSAGRNDRSRCRAPNCDRANRFATVPTAAGTFSPQRPLLRLDGHGYSPALLQKIVRAGGRLHSFADAAFALSLSGLSISARHVQQLTQEVGTDQEQVRDEQALRRRRRQLSPQAPTAPAAVAVEVDGGRLRTRAVGSGPGVHAAENKEDKIACLVTLTNAEHAEDPQPEPPPSFVQPRRIQRLVQQMAGQAGDPLAAADAPAAAAPEGEGPATAVLDPETEPWSPQRLVRTCVASMAASHSFGPLMAAECNAGISTRRSGGRSWPTAWATTGRSIAATSPTSCRSWICCTWSDTCSRWCRRSRPRRSVGRCTCAGCDSADRGRRPRS